MSIFLNLDRTKFKRLNEFEDEDGNDTTEEVEDDEYKEEGEENNETNSEEDSNATDSEEDSDQPAPEGEEGGEGDAEEGNEDNEPKDLSAGDDDGIEDGGYSEDEPTNGGDEGGDEGSTGEDTPEGNEGEEESGNDDEYRLDGSDNTDDGVEDGGYSEDDEGGDEGGDKGAAGGDENTEGEDSDNTDTDDGGETSEEPDDSKLKQLEGEIFDQLTDEQKKIKINELKSRFEEMYERCDSIIKIVNNVTAPDEETSKVFEYINDNLTDMKQYIYDYFVYTFDTKSYLENSAQYQKYIAILNSLNSVLEIIVKRNEKKDKESK